MKNLEDLEHLHHLGHLADPYPLEVKNLVDLDYPEDSEAGVDGNLIMTGGKMVEVQMSAEGSTFSRVQMDTLLDLAEKGIRELNAVQLSAVS